MNGLDVTCSTCKRTWSLNIAASLYVQLDMSTRPCPYCESYTLSEAGTRPEETPGKLFARSVESRPKQRDQAG